MGGGRRKLAGPRDTVAPSVNLAAGPPRPGAPLPVSTRRLLRLALLAVAAGCADRTDWTLDDWEAHGAEEAAEGDLDAAMEPAFRAFTGGDRAHGRAEFERLAEAGHVGAMRMLADAHQHGEGVEVDYERAAEWLERAAEAGGPDAARDQAAFRAPVD